MRSFRVALERHDVGWAFWTYKRMDTRASMRTFNRPAYWDELTTYQEMQSDPFAKPRKPRPSLAHERAALEGLLRNARFENTRENIGYVEALGMHPRGAHDLNFKAAGIEVDGKPSRPRTITREKQMLPSPEAALAESQRCSERRWRKDHHEKLPAAVSQFRHQQGAKSELWMR